VQVNINIPIRLLIRLVRTLENIRDDYRAVHQRELAAARRTDDPGDRGKFFYQSDQELYQEELKRKVADEIRSGDYSRFRP
jgi:hypothetical protein